jgi:hypothetical protein
MATVVYALCALTSIACAGLLTRAHRAGGGRLLLWSAACFWLLALNNILLFIDLVVWTDQDLSPARLGTGLAAPLVLLFGFIVDTDLRR